MTTDPNLAEVAFNFKTDDGKTVRHQLTRKNVILGPNGSRKSAVAQAVALAVSGAVDDLMGHRVTRDPGLLTGMMHMRGLDGEPMFARVNFDTGGNCQWETTRDGSRIKTPVHIKPKWVIPESSKDHSPHFPLREIEEVLEGSAKKAREQFLSWVCQDIDEAEVRKYLSRCEDAYERLTEGMESSAPVDRLAHALKQADSQMRKFNASAKASAQLREDLAAEVSAKVDAAEVLAARDKVRTLESEYEEAVRADAVANSKQTRALLEEKLGGLRAEEQTLRDRQAAYEKTLEHVEDEDLEFDGVSGALDAFAWVASEDYYGEPDATEVSCPFCSSTVEREHMVNCHTFYSGRLEEMSQGRRAYDDVRENLVDTKRRLRALGGRITDAQTALEDLPVGSDTSDIDLESARSALADARADLESKRDAASKWEQMDKAAKREREAKQMVEQFRTLKIDGQKAVKALLEHRTDAFCDRVSAYLPNGWRFGVMVEDDGRDVFYYGLSVGEGALQYLRLGLSEGQRAAVISAVAAVLDEMNPVPLSVIILPDRGWDTKTLGEVLRALVNVPQHVFVTATVDPGMAALDGWNVIRVGEIPETPYRYKREKFPALPEDTGVKVTPALVLDPMLVARPQPMPSGRGRGGKFRAIKNRVEKAIEEHGFKEVVASFSYNHPEATFVKGVTEEEFAESVAHFLFPVCLDD